jgi:hypothetical protein
MGSVGSIASFFAMIMGSVSLLIGSVGIVALSPLIMGSVDLISDSVARYRADLSNTTYHRNMNNHKIDTLKGRIGKYHSQSYFCVLEL